MANQNMLTILNYQTEYKNKHTQYSGALYFKHNSFQEVVQTLNQFLQLEIMQNELIHSKTLNNTNNDKVK